MKLLILAAVVLSGLLLLGPGRAQVAADPMTRIVSPDTPQNVRLVAAVEAADLAAVQDALRSGASADTETGWEAPAGAPPQELTPVALMAWGGFPDRHVKLLPIFRLLIQNVSASSITDPKLSARLLYAAVQMDDLDSVRGLAARGINLNARYERASGILDASIEQNIAVKTLSPISAFLLEHGVQVNALDGEGRTPLMSAAQEDKAGVVQALLAHGADPAIRDKRGWTALDWAALFGRDDSISLLRDRSPMDLHEAAQFGDVVRLRAYLDAGADPNALKMPLPMTMGGNTNSPKAQATTPLLEAMKSGSLETVRLLLDRGARVNQARADGTTALHVAALYGDAPLAALLLDRGANINAVAPMRGRPVTPLTYAVAQAQVAVVALLLKRGVDLKHGQGESALDSAIREAGNGWLRRPLNAPAKHVLHGDAVLDARGQIIDLLLRAGVDLKSKDCHALFLAASGGQPGLVDALLSKGAAVNGRGMLGPPGSLDNGGTALMGAIDALSGAYEDEVLLKDGTESGGNLKDIHQSEGYARQSVMLLLAHGADVNLPDERGTTPLMQCVTDGLHTLAGTLLAHGAKVDAANPAGQTALMQAASGDDSAMVTLLLAHHAGINRHDRAGETPLMLAVDDGSNDAYRASEGEDEQRFVGSQVTTPMSLKDLPNPDGHPKTVRLLLKHGASVNATAADGSTALSRARKQGFRQVVMMLLQAGAKR